MIITDETFEEYILLAQAEALTEREQSLLNARYGIMNGQPQTLEQVGQQFDISRERVRQLVQRSFRKLRSKGKRDIKRGKEETASALLLRYLEAITGQEGETKKVALINLASTMWPHIPQETGALPFLIGLVFPEDQAKQALAELLRFYSTTIQREKKQQVLSERQEKTFLSLFRDVRWPRETQAGLDRFHALSASLPPTPKFQVPDQERQTFLSEKMRRAVLYRSLLERNMLQLLEATDDVIFYQEQPWLISEIVQGKQVTYVPDIFCTLKDGRGVLIEVTPWRYMALSYNWTKYNALRQFCLKQGWGLLITDGTRTLQQVKQYPISQPFQTALLEALAEAADGSLTWKEYQTVRDASQGTWKDFIALILTHRLRWSLEPFSLKN